MLKSYKSIKKCGIGETAILNNNGAFDGHEVIILDHKKEGDFHPWNNYYLVQLIEEDEDEIPYIFKVLEWDLV